MTRATWIYAAACVAILALGGGVLYAARDPELTGPRLEAARVGVRPAQQPAGTGDVRPFEASPPPADMRTNDPGSPVHAGTGVEAERALHDRPSPPSPGEHAEKGLSDTRPRMDSGGGPRGPGGLLARAVVELNLSEQQQQKIAPILEHGRAEIRRVRDEAEQAGESPEQIRDRTQPLRDRLQHDVEAVLTPAQRDQLHELIQKLREEQWDGVDRIPRPRP